MNSEIQTLLREASQPLDEGYMLRLYDLADKSRDEKTLESRSHTAAVVSLHLAWEVEQMGAEGSQDELTMRAFSKLAVAQTLLSKALDTGRTYAAREDCALFATFLAPIQKLTDELEKLCGECVDKVMERGDMTPEQERAALAEVVETSDKAIPMGREIMARYSRIVLLSTTGTPTLQ